MALSKDRSRHCSLIYRQSPLFLISENAQLISDLQPAESYKTDAMILASLLQQDSRDLDSGDGGEMLDTARSLFDFLGFLGWICQGFS